MTRPASRDSNEMISGTSLPGIIIPVLPHDMQPLPKTSRAWLVAVAICAIAVSIAFYCLSIQWREGLIVTDHRNPGYGGAAWGLYVGFYVFFVGVSFAGITVAALSRLFDIEALRPLSRLAELITITALIVGAGAIITDLGRPLDGLMKLPRFANPRSPFYGTFTLVVAGYLFSSLVYFFLSGRADSARMAKTSQSKLRFMYRFWASGYKDTPAERTRHRRVTYWLALTILPLLVIAHSTLGFIFGIQSGRPGWYSALQAPAFVVMAGVSGIGMVIVVAAGVRRLCKLHDRIPDRSLRWLGNLLWVLALTYLYFMLVEELTATYAAPEADRHVAHEITMGSFAPLFWITVGCLVLTFIIPFVLFLRRRTSVTALVVVGLLANVAAILKRFLIVVPSQTHGALTPVEPPLPHVPSLVELGVIFGMFGAVALMILIFIRIFPIVPTPHDGPRLRRPPRDALRTLVTISTAAAAVFLIALGLTDSFRLYSGHEIDPRLPFAPVIFASGVMLLFSSAIVYELFPKRPDPASTPVKEEP